MRGACANLFLILINMPQKQLGQNMFSKIIIAIMSVSFLSSCAGVGLPYTPAGLANGVDRDAVRLNDAHTRAINGVIALNILRARDGWPTGYTTLSGIQFVPQVELDLTGNFGPLGLGNPPLPFGESAATIERDESSSATYTVNPFADQDGAPGLYNIEGTEEIFERLVKGGWPIEVLVPLMVRSITYNDETCILVGDGQLAAFLNKGAKPTAENKKCWTQIMDKIFTKTGSSVWDYKLAKNDDVWNCKKLYAAPSDEDSTDGNSKIIPYSPKGDVNILSLLENNPQEGLGARISAINSAATGELGDQTSRVLVDADGVQLCSRPTNTASKTLFKKDKDGNDEAIFDEMSFRSFDDMVYFVGETIRGPKSTFKENRLCIENCFNDDMNNSLSGTFKGTLSGRGKGIALAHVDGAITGTLTGEVKLTGADTHSKNDEITVEGIVTPAAKSKRYLFQVKQGPVLRNNHAVQVNHAGENYYALSRGLRQDPNFDDRSGTVLAILSQILLLNQSEAFLEAPENILSQ